MYTMLHFVEICQTNSDSNKTFLIYDIVTIALIVR